MTDQTTPRRRGRPPIVPGVPNARLPAPVVETPVEAAPADISTSKRRRRSSVGGHSMKLQAPERKGFVRRWFNDLGNRLADAGEFAYDYVTDKGVQSSDPSSRISRLVGTKATGEPLRAYLMETPDELYAEGVTEREQIHSQVDQAIVKGGDFTGEMDERFSHPNRHGSIRVER